MTLNRLVIAFAAISALLAATAQAEVRYPPGLRVGLEPPGNMIASKRFSGFEDPDRHVAITVLDLPGGAYPNIEAAVFDTKQNALQDAKREAFGFESGMGFLVTARGQQNGVTLHKWFLLATASVGGAVGNLTTLITVEVPEAALATYSDAAIRAALKTVTFRNPPVEEQIGLLPFKLSERAGFRVMQVMPEGGVILTDGPSNDINAQPYMLIGAGRGGPGDARDRGRFARDLLSSSPVRDLSVTTAENMRISGGPGHEIRATAKGLDGTPLSLVQWVRFGSGGFMRIVGVAHMDKWDELFPRFRAVRDGIEPN